MNQRIPAQVHRKSKNPTPIKIGVRFVLAGTGVDTGLAGTLPAYSAGAGGGTGMGREADGTGAARGEAMVAAGSNVEAS